MTLLSNKALDNLKRKAMENYATKEDLENLKKEILEAINPKMGNKTIFTPEPKKEVWELYPNYRSCRDRSKYGYYYELNGKISTLTYDGYEILCHTEKLAKRQLAELQLAKIADKWGEGIEIGNYVWKAICNNGGKISVDTMPKNSFYFNSMPFYFKTEEQCKKSIELHHQLWKDWFMID